MKHFQTKSRQKNARENNERALEEEKRPKLQFKVTEFWYRQSLVEPPHLNIRRRWVSAEKDAAARNEVPLVRVIEKKSISSTYWMRRDAHGALLSVEHETSRWEQERAEDGAEGYLFPEMGWE